MREKIDEFLTITGYNLENFFLRFSIFVSVYYQSIIDYYNGGDLFIDAFDELDYLTEQVRIIEPLWQLHRDRFNGIEYWTMIDSFSDISVSLETARNMSRWARSSRLTQFDQDIKVTRILGQGESLESVASDLGFTDVNNSWTDIAINNLINEEDYDTDGGLKFEVSLRNNLSLNLPNIVDNIQGNNIYGKDIKKKITFLNNDLETVVYRDAVNQSIDTILNTTRGSIPEFPSDGIEENIVGSNINAIQYPVLFRNLLNLFRKDSRFTDIRLLDLRRQDDNVFLQIEITTVLRNNIISNLRV